MSTQMTERVSEWVNGRLVRDSNKRSPRQCHIRLKARDTGSTRHRHGQRDGQLDEDSGQPTVQLLTARLVQRMEATLTTSRS